MIECTKAKHLAKVTLIRVKFTRINEVIFAQYKCDSYNRNYSNLYHEQVMGLVEEMEIRCIDKLKTTVPRTRK